MFARKKVGKNGAAAHGTSLRAALLAREKELHPDSYLATLSKLLEFPVVTVYHGYYILVCRVESNDRCPWMSVDMSVGTLRSLSVVHSCPQTSAEVHLFGAVYVDGCPRMFMDVYAVSVCVHGRR